MYQTMQKKELTSSYKYRSSLDKLFIERLADLYKSIPLNSRRNYIPFPLVFEKICRSFQIKKVDAMTLLFEMQTEGYLEIIKFHGVKIKKRGKEIGS